MSEATQILALAESGDPRAREALFPLVYDELRLVAAQKLARERPGQTLQPTALVHEAWLRLGGEAQPVWQNRAHFFAAASEAMRRILVDKARHRMRLRHGGGQERVDLDEVQIAAPEADDTLLGVSDALDALAREDPLEAEVVKLRFFVGLSNDETAAVLGVSEKTVRRYWTHAKAWLYQRMQSSK